MLLISVLYDMLLDEVCRLYLWLFDREAYATLVVVPDAYRLSQDGEATQHYPPPLGTSQEEWMAIGERAEEQAAVLWGQAEKYGWQVQ